MQTYKSSGRTSKHTCAGDERGSSILEAALGLPVLLMLACGVMDFGRMFYAAIVVESAARAGVQLGSFSIGKAGAFTDMDAAAVSDSSGQGVSGISISSRTFCACTTGSGEISCTSDTCGGAVPSGYVETAASYTFTPIIRYPGLPNSIVLRSAARFRAQ